MNLPEENTRKTRWDEVRERSGVEMYVAGGRRVPLHEFVT